MFREDRFCEDLSEDLSKDLSEDSAVQDAVGVSTGTLMVPPGRGEVKVWRLRRGACAKI